MSSNFHQQTLAISHAHRHPVQREMARRVKDCGNINHPHPQSWCLKNRRLPMCVPRCWRRCRVGVKSISAVFSVHGGISLPSTWHRRSTISTSAPERGEPAVLSALPSRRASMPCKAAVPGKLSASGSCCGAECFSSSRGRWRMYWCLCPYCCRRQRGHSSHSRSRWDFETILSTIHRRDRCVRGWTERPGIAWRRRGRRCVGRSWWQRRGRRRRRQWRGRRRQPTPWSAFGGGGVAVGGSGVAVAVGSKGVLVGVAVGAVDV